MISVKTRILYVPVGLCELQSIWFLQQRFFVSKLDIILNGQIVYSRNEQYCIFYMLCCEWAKYILSLLIWPGIL